MGGSDSWGGSDGWGVRSERSIAPRAKTVVGVNELMAWSNLVERAHHTMLCRLCRDIAFN
jgi:hypothetical protein